MIISQSEVESVINGTCHNPHQWDPHRDERGPGENVEGDVINSFLRPKLHAQFCTLCHGDEGLLMLKYFHSHLGRQKRGGTFTFE